MNRQSLLVSITLLAVLGFVFWFFFFRETGITIREKKVPLSQILGEIKRQGGIPVHSNLDPGTLVSMDVEKVTLPEAMEVLAVTLDARWAPYFALAQDQSGLAELLGHLESPTGSEALARFQRPLPGPVEWVLGEYLPNPKKLVWSAAEARGKNTLHEHLEIMAQASEAGYVVKKDWNPALTSLNLSDRVDRAVGQLAGQLKARHHAFLYVSRRSWGGGYGAGEGGRNLDGERSSSDLELLDQRIQRRLAELPQGERAEAQKNWDEQKKTWAELQAMSPEDRRARMQELMEDPVMQEKMEEMNELRDRRRSPEARRARYQRYIQRKSSLKGNS
ncbi:MAG: hypothetical protein HC904_04945 [Blastochloris sp.]|nr:hypothetical protein [Blastochloris sp.]